MPVCWLPVDNSHEARREKTSDTQDTDSNNANLNSVRSKPAERSQECSQKFTHVAFKYYVNVFMHICICLDF